MGGPDIETAMSPVHIVSTDSRWRLPYWATRIFRYALALATIVHPLAFLALFVIGGVQPEKLPDNALLTFAQKLAAPAVQAIGQAVNFHPTFHGWDFILLGLAAVSITIRQLLLWPVKTFEGNLRARYKPKPVVLAGQDANSGESVVRSSRMSMLREYHETREILMQQKRHLAFLSIDVVGSTKMKVGEDKLTIEHAFSEYKKFVEKILKSHHIWKVAWTPDGIMCAFNTATDCVGAAQELLQNLAWFNDGVHHLRTPFNVRCGANMGEVVFPEIKPMEDISDEVIDVAGHMQKYAAHGALWISKAMLADGISPDGFRPITDQQVDGREVMEWRADALGDKAARGASTPAG